MSNPGQIVGPPGPQGPAGPQGPQGAQGNPGVVSPVTAVTYTANHTFTPSDAGQVVEANNAGAMTLTIDTNANQNIPVNSVIEVFQLGAGQVTIAASGGVTLLSDGGKVKTAAQYATIGLRQRATDVWVLSGDLG